jgi:hypothetical protein
MSGQLASRRGLPHKAIYDETVIRERTSSWQATCIYRQHTYTVRPFTRQEGLQRLQQRGAGAAGARGLRLPELGRQQQPRPAAGAAEDAAAQPAVVPPPGKRPAESVSAITGQPQAGSGPDSASGQQLMRSGKAPHAD